MKKVYEILSNEDYLDGIYKEDYVVLENIYQSQFPAILNYISNVGGHEAMAKDIFQEAMVVIYQKVIANKLELTCSFSTYLFAICKRIYLKKNSQRKPISGLEEGSEYDFLEESIVDLISESERYALYYEKFDLLGKDCKKILSLFFDKVSMVKIGEIMGFGSVSYTKKRKFNCKNKLIQLIQSDQRFNELKQN
ncbi:MAG: sigma-70 family RNA polymerase sigma factor [Bacteroidota bacterium]